VIFDLRFSIGAGAKHGVPPRNHSLATKVTKDTKVTKNNRNDRFVIFVSFLTFVVRFF